MSSSSTASSIADIIQVYQTVQSADICVIASSALFIYDCILCLGREYQYVWRSGKSRVSRLLFLYIRYTTLLPSILAFWTITPLTDTSCTAIGWTFTCLGILGFIGPAVVTTLRTYVLSGRKALLSGVAFILGLGPFLVNASTAYQVPPVNLPPPLNCGQGYTGSMAMNLGLTICARCCAILADVIAIAVTWRATRTCRRLLGDGSFQQASLQHIMWTNGNIYFFTLLSINILDLILVTLSIIVQNSAGSYVILFLDPISAILNCHFLLDLYEANVRIERGGSSLSRSHPTLSLRFVAGSESEARGAADAEGPSGDLALFSAFAGPLYTFQDTDTEFDLVNGELEVGSLE